MYGTAGICRYIDIPGRVHIEKPKTISQSSGGGYTDTFAEYLANQADNTSPLDPMTRSLQERYRGSNVTNVTNSYGYVDNKLVTAMSDNEYKMCTDAKKATTDSKDKGKGTPESIYQLAFFFVIKNVFGKDIDGEPNSVTELYDDNGKLLQKRYYDSNGKVYKDIDYSHGNGDGSHI